MAKTVGLEEIKSGGELQQEIQQGEKDVTPGVPVSMVSAAQKAG